MVGCVGVAQQWNGKGVVDGVDPVVASKLQRVTQVGIIIQK